MKRPKLGDVFEIPLTNGQRTFGQYVYYDSENGPLVVIFRLIAQPDEEIDVKRLKSSGLLFPPVITGLFAALRSGLWKVIGRLPTDDFEYPYFTSAFYDERSGKYGMWHLWDGSISRPIGYDLPEEYQSLERLIVWHPLNLVKRIESGDNPYAYPRHGE